MDQEHCRGVRLDALWSSRAQRRPKQTTTRKKIATYCYHFSDWRAGLYCWQLYPRPPAVKNVNTKISDFGQGACRERVFWISNEVELLKIPPFSGPGDGNIQEVAVVLRREIPCKMRNMYLQHPPTSCNLTEYKDVPSPQKTPKASKTLALCAWIQQSHQRKPGWKTSAFYPCSCVSGHPPGSYGTIKYTQSCNECHAIHWLHLYIIIRPTKSHPDWRQQGTLTWSESRFLSPISQRTRFGVSSSHLSKGRTQTALLPRNRFMPPRILWRSWDPDRLQRANMSPTTGVPRLAQVQKQHKRHQEKVASGNRNICKARGWRMRWHRDPQHLHPKLLRVSELLWQKPKA